MVQIPEISQFPSVAQSCTTLCDPIDCTRQASLSITNSQGLVKLMSIALVMPSNHPILCCPLLQPSIFPSIRVFSNESVLHIRWPKLSNEYLGLTSFRVDQFDLLPVQGTQEFSPTLQFKSINFLALSFVYGPTLTSIHDYWENHSFDYMDLCRQSNVSAF